MGASADEAEAVAPGMIAEIRLQACPKCQNSGTQLFVGESVAAGGVLVCVPKL